MDTRSFFFNGRPKLVTRGLTLPQFLLTVALFSTAAAAVGANTHYPHVPQDIVRQCANNTASVERIVFCHTMATCILSRVNAGINANMNAGSSILSMLPTAVWLLAGSMEDMVSIARRDPYFGLVMAIAVGGAKGLPRGGRPTEIDAGSWSTDVELSHSASAVVVPGLLNMPADSHVKMAFVRRELQILQMRIHKTGRESQRARSTYLVIGWLLRLSSLACTAGVVWLYFVRADTTFIAWACPKQQFWTTMFFNVWPPLFEFLATPLLEYREHWTIEDLSLVCYTYGRAPASARGVLRGVDSGRKRPISYWSNLIPQLSSSEKLQPVCTLTWKATGLTAELARTLFTATRYFVYLWSTVTLASIVLAPAAHATTWFMSTVGLVLYNRFILIALDALPGVIGQIQEVSIR